MSQSGHSAAPTFQTRLHSNNTSKVPDDRFSYKTAKKTRNIDILVFGDTSAGKKAFVESFIGIGGATANRMKTSRSQKCEYLLKKVTMPCKTTANVRFWQQTQQERPFTTRLFREADCIIYIGDVTKTSAHLSKNLAKFSTLVNNECNEDAIRILVGNKIDLKNSRALESSEGQKLANQFRLDKYTETSALCNIDVSKTIDDILAKISSKTQLRMKDSESSISISSN